MPGMDGIELLSWLRQFDANIALMIEGACGFLNKPVQPSDLQKEARRAIERSRHDRRLCQMARHVEQIGESQRSLVASHS